MTPARLAAQDFSGASYFKTFGYGLFRLTSSDRFWHKEPVQYSLPSDSQGQNHRFVAAGGLYVKPCKETLQDRPISAGPLIAAQMRPLHRGRNPEN
jgi:hypothetical protein